MTKNVHTTVEEQTWKLAVLNNVSWSKALTLGIEAMLNVNNEKQKIHDEILQLEVRIKYLKSELERIEQIEKEKEKKKRESIVMEF
jgi:sensor histidine kinase YesM